MVVQTSFIYIFSYMIYLMENINKYSKDSSLEIFYEKNDNYFFQKPIKKLILLIICYIFFIKIVSDFYYYLLIIILKIPLNYIHVSNKWWVTITKPLSSDKLLGNGGSKAKAPRAVSQDVALAVNIWKVIFPK